MTVLDLLGLAFLLVYSAHKAARARGYTIDWDATKRLREEFADIPAMSKVVARMPSRRITLVIAFWWAGLALVCARLLLAAWVQL